MRTKYNGPESPVLHTKVNVNRSTGSKKEDVKGFLPYMDAEAIWSCGQDYINIFSIL